MLNERETKRENMKRSLHPAARFQTHNIANCTFRMIRLTLFNVKVNLKKVQKHIQFIILHLNFIIGQFSLICV